MGCISLCTSFLTLSILLTLALIFFPHIPPDVTYSSFSIEPSKHLKGPLAKNSILDEAERLYEGYLVGPESIASRSDNELFVSNHDGNIIRIYGKDFDTSQVVASIGPGCAGHWEEHICGRPLGLRFINDKDLLVADSYLGIFLLNVDNGDIKMLVDQKKPINGKTPKVIDDLDVDKEGNIYWTDASANAFLSDGVIELLSDPSGRFIKYDAKKKTNVVLLDKMHFPNGVQMSPDKKFVLVAETFRFRIHRYWLAGPKAGTSDVFVSGLPGMPDNIRARKNGGYYASLIAPQRGSLYETLAAYPTLRKVVVRMTWLVQKFFRAIDSIYPNDFCAKFVYKTFHLGVISDMLSTGEALVVELDESGKIVGSLHGSKGVLISISETHQVGDYLFFGSPYAEFLGRLHISKTAERKKPAAPSKAQTKEEL